MNVHKLMHSAAMLVGVAVCLAVTQAAPAMASGPALTLKPGSGPPGSTIQVNGSGFGATEAVDVYFDTTDMVLAATDSTGAFSVAFQAPISAQPGQHYVTAVGRHSGLSAQAPFLVQTNWAQLHFSPSHRGLNPYENTLNVNNVASIDQAWAFATGNTISLSSPAVVNGVVYVGSDDQSIYAIKASSGAKLWSYATGGVVEGSPAVANGVVYEGSADGHVYALKASNGSIVWNDDLSALEPFGFYSSPATSGGDVYITGRSGTVYALAASDGFANWAFPMAAPESYSSPAVSGGTVYTADSNGDVYALSASSGSQEWKTTVAVSGQGVYASSPTVAGGRVFVGTTDADGTAGAMTALDASAGFVLWSLSVPVDSTAAVANGELFFIDINGDLNGLVAKDGSVACQLSFGGNFFASPVVANGVVYAQGDAFSASNCKLLFSYSAFGSGPDSPAVANGVVYFSPGNNNLYALDLAGGTAGAKAPRASQLKPDFSLHIQPQGKSR